MPRAAAAPTALRISALVRRLNPFSLSHAYQREVFLVTAVGASALYFTALATFSPLDASALSAVRPAAPLLNLAGRFGAELSGRAIYLFGLVAWLFPIPLIGTAVLVVLRRSDAFARTRILGWALAFLSLCAAAAWQLADFGIEAYEFPAGGLLGSGASTALTASMGRIGAGIAVSTIALVGTLLVLRQSLLSPLGRTLAPLWSKLRDFEWRVPRSDETEPAHPAQDAPQSTVIDSVGEIPAMEPALFDAPRGVTTDVAELQDGGDDAASFPVFPEPRERDESTSTPYTPPPLSVFRKSDPSTAFSLSQRELEATANLLVKTFEDFGVHGKIIGNQPGPVVTVFEYQPDAGVKQSKVLGLIDDVALALKVDSIFIHPVKGKSALGVQVPNAKREQVHLGDIVGTSAFRDAESPLTFGMGKSLNGQPICSDLATMPHLLAAGATGSGKSVAINALLCSIIMKAKPEDVRMILVDPKMLELSVYEGIPHLLMPVITEPAKASLALKWAAHEMERRYRLMQLASVRNLAGFNAYWTKASEGRRQQLREAAGDDSISKLPYILLVIDELADLMMTAPKDVESSIQRLAQKARASGIHMVLATQRPSVDVITGVIKANLPCRIAFQVVSKHDSRTILDGIGAEKLLGRGDMLLQKPGSGRLERVQGALITDEEVLEMVASVKGSGKTRYDDAIISWIDDEFARQKDQSGAESDIAMDDDPKWDEAVGIARQHGVVSASFLQRHLKIGYNRAARIVEFMESQGLVDKADGAKPRKWLGAA